MSNDKKHICIIIPTFNRLGYLRVILSQLLVQEPSTKFTITPVVIVDGSNDGTNEMLDSEFLNVKIIKGSGNWWWTKSVNEGIKYALQNLSPDFFLLLNDDSQIEPNYLNLLFDTYVSVGKDCVIGSISVTDTTPKRVSFAGVKKIDWLKLKKENYYKGFDLLSNIPSNCLLPTQALNGRGTLISTKIIKELNYLDEKNFPQYGSDDDLALRSIKLGYDVLISYSAIIIDRAQDTSKGTAYRQDSIWVFIKSFFTWNSVNYIPKQIRFFYIHGIKILIPYYFIKFILGTSNAYFFKYKKLKL